VVDAIQSLGVEPLDVRSLGVDVLSSSAHKGLLGPHGIGFFYCSGELIEDMEPMSVAGTCYESSASGEKTLKKTAARFEGGNYNYAGVYGASAGLDLVLELGGAAERCFSLAEAFREGVRGVRSTTRRWRMNGRTLSSSPIQVSPARSWEGNLREAA
jgi:selenocysteine lyase/cysteine desulfurase